MFNEHIEEANRQADTVKAGASELLQMYGLVRQWAFCHLPDDPRLEKEKLAFAVVCKAVDIMLMAKRRAWTMQWAGQRLEAHLVEHAKLHADVHGENKIRPKHHWAFDVAQQMQGDESVFDAFIVERLHLRVKRVTENITSMVSFETATLSGVLNSHARSLATRKDTSGLHGRTTSSSMFQGATIADSMELGGFECAVNDVVFLGESCAYVVACALESGKLYAIVDEMVLKRELTHHSGVWTTAGASRKIWRLEDMCECVAWRSGGENEVEVVRM